MSAEKERKGRRARPGLMRANGALLFAAMGLAGIMLARLLLGRAWSSPEAAVLWDGMYGALLLALAMRLMRTIKPAARTETLRLNTPTIAQVILTGLAVGAGLLFSDDLTLLVGAGLQRTGMDVSRQIGAIGRAPGWLYGARVLFEGILPSIALGFFFHGAQMAAWEKRGTKYALWAASALCALLCGSVVLLPSSFAIALAVGYIAVYTGSLPLAIFLRMGILVGSVAARYMQGYIGMEPGRFGRLWTELGGMSGMALLALETLLLGVVFFCVVRAVCCAKPRQATTWRERPRRIRPMRPEGVFVLATAVATGVMLLLTDFLQMTGVF